MKLSEALWQDDERMSGAVCFRHTRVPVEFVFDFLANGTMDEFYEGYPNVSRSKSAPWSRRPKNSSRVRPGSQRDDSPRQLRSARSQTLLRSR